MPHETDMRSARPRIGPPASGREGDAPPVPGSAPEPDGVVDVRTLRELGHDVTMRAASVRLLAGVAARESELDPAVTRRLRQIADEAERVIDICGSFLDPSRKAGPSVLDLLAADAAGSAWLRHQATIDVVAESVVAAAHPVDVLRILDNLLDNACRAAGPGGRVRLEVERAGDRPGSSWRTPARASAAGSPATPRSASASSGLWCGAAAGASGWAAATWGDWP